MLYGLKIDERTMVYYESSTLIRMYYLVFFKKGIIL